MKLIDKRFGAHGLITLEVSPLKIAVVALLILFLFGCTAEPTQPSQTQLNAERAVSNLEHLNDLTDDAVLRTNNIGVIMGTSK